jgi:hypothetical protein
MGTLSEAVETRKIRQGIAVRGAASSAVYHKITG